MKKVKEYTITINKEELEVLESLLYDGNVCEKGCLKQLKSGRFPKYHCGDTNSEGELGCYVERAKETLKEKIANVKDNNGVWE